MAALIDKNDCSHRGVCKYVGDGMCLTECGHYTVETQNTDNQQLKAEIAALVTWFESYTGASNVGIIEVIKRMRQLSAV